MNKLPYSASAIILAGGQSSRMGSCKAELLWDGKTFVEYQISKMRDLGIEEILISGYPVPIAGTRYVPDKYPARGPLAGIHAGLLAAKNSHCLITGIDTPLVPVDVLSELMDVHISTSADITVLSCGDKIEPVIGVYETWLSEIAEQILVTDNTSIRALLNKVGYTKYQFCGDEFLLCDCNTPEEYEKAIQISNTHCR